MRVYTPGIAWHNRERVSAVDFQPRPFSKDDQILRLATGGDDHHVIIWSVSLVNLDTKFQPPHCLCDLNRHQNSVNIVRWSPDGSLLASGDTDSAIFLWQKQDGEAPPDIFSEKGDDESMGENGCPAGPTENWTVLRMLRGHLQDVTGLAFSPSGAHLLSCSTDSSAILFDVNKGTKTKILGDHKGWVNGVAFDPKQKFAVTISSDRFMRVYSTKNYKAPQRINKCKLVIPPSTTDRTVRLFHDDTFKSFYRRLSFSPDGELLVVPSGVLDIEGETETPHCTYIFSRKDFSKPVLRLLNKEYSVAVRFSPKKYKLRNLQPSNDSSKKPWECTQTLFALPYRMIYAVATPGTVVFYDTQQAEPFATVSQIHYIGLLDLAWSPDGNTMIVSSTDGFCTVVNFKEGELGELYTKDLENNITNGNDVTQFPTTQITSSSNSSSPKTSAQEKPVSVISVKKKSLDDQKKQDTPMDTS